MLEYNPIPTNKSQFKEGTQIPSKKRIRDKKYKNVFNEIKKLKGDIKKWFIHIQKESLFSIGIKVLKLLKKLNSLEYWDNKIISSI